MRFFCLCFALFLALPMEAQQLPTGRRKHAMSRAFTEFTGEDCFDITRQEADQAFRERSWDDAAALYRAAKSCADADQTGRRDMNLRIRACRDAAERELLDKEAAAQRLARQAIASNRADDAQDLLQNYDRGLAYRLADFANQYIAPPGEPNADCLQATFDAWYYVPQQRTNLSKAFDSLRVPLCYQLSQENSAAKQLQFGMQGSTAKLYQLMPSEHLFRSWDAQTLRPDKPLSVDEDFQNFQVSPDGRTIVFYGPTLFAFWYNGREMFRQAVAKSSAFAFSSGGDAFCYYDPEEKKVMQLDLRIKYATQQRKSNTYGAVKPPVPVPYASGLLEEPLSLAVPDNQLWLGYRDSVVICRKKNDGTPWQRVRVVGFDGLADSGGVFLSTVLLFPEQEAVLRITGTGSNFYRLPAAPGRYPALVPHTHFPYGLSGIAPNASLVAEVLPGDDGRGNKLYLIDPASGIFHYGAFTQLSDNFSGSQSVFSPDGRWFAAVNTAGVVKLWALADRQSEPLVTYDRPAGSVKLSPNGQRVYLESEEKIEAYAVPARMAAWTLKTPRKAPGTLVVADQWLAYSTSSDSLVVVSADQRQMLAFPLADWLFGEMTGLAFDPAGTYLAYSPTPDSVVVRRLPDGAVLARRSFSGSIKSLTFLPDQNKLAVVVQTSNSYDVQQQNVVRIWDFAASSAALPTVRLHGYAIQMVAISPLGDRIAFSDNRTVRIFDLDQLADERVSIRAFSHKFVQSLAFQPDGQALAAGYDDGTVIFWDVQNAQATFELENVGERWSNLIVQMAFAPTGRRLRYLNSSNNLYERELDPDTIRAMAQTPHRQLAAFRPEQILQYDLEPMLSYDRNFEALASSGDGPLIRSFFDFYQEQALASNNIEQVGIYCQRAFELYQRLDQDFQTRQRSTMLALYEDYSWKWLLRDNRVKSAQLVADMNRYFGNPPEAVLAGAFTALLNDDPAAATRLFVEWLAQADDRYMEDNVPVGLVTLNNKFRQLLDYNLLAPGQIGYLCALFGEMTNLDERICAEGSPDVVIPFDPASELRWKIRLDLIRARRTRNHTQGERYLESALANTVLLLRRNSGSRLEGEKTRLALASHYLAWGDFEAGTTRAAALYRRASEVLVTRVAFSDQGREAERQHLLARSYLTLGDYLLANQQTQAAFDTYGLGINLIDRPPTTDPLPDVEGALYVQRGMAALLLGKTTEARTDFEAAAEILPGGLNAFYFGPPALLEGREAEALEQYQGISDESTLSRAWFDLQRLAEGLPAHRARIEQFIPAVTAAAKHHSLDTLYVGYLLANLRRQHFGAQHQWLAALTESERALRYAEQALNADDKAYEWQDSWLDALLNQSYYLLLARSRDLKALAQAIRYAEQAEKYVDEVYTYYTNAAYLKTNHAHALLLRDAPGDRAQAIALYRDFLNSVSGNSDPWEVLHKDFRDLYAAGIQWPGLRELIMAIKPNGVELSAGDWREMGVIQ